MKKKSGLNAKGRKMSDEQKNKISESRKKYLMENPHMVPYKLNHSSKISYQITTCSFFRIINIIYRVKL
jgi:hypothetical protein